MIFLGVSLILQILLAVVLGLYIYFIWSLQYWKRRGIPYLRSSFPFGSARNISIHGGENLKILYNELKQQGAKHGAGIYAFSVPKYLIIDPQTIQHVLIKDFNNFSDRGVSINGKNDPLNENFVFFEEKRWHPVRNKLIQSFTGLKIKMMFDSFLKFAGHLEEALKHLCRRNEPVNLKEIGECFAADVIGSSAFGLECNSFKNTDSEFRKYGRRAFDNMSLLKFMNMTLILLYPKLSKLLRLRMYDTCSLNFFTNVVGDVLRFRTANKCQQKDLLQYLIDAKGKDNVAEDYNATIRKITADAFALFAAGGESSSSIIIYCLYELTLQPSIQQRVRDEVQKVLTAHNNEITYDAIMSMTYLHQVLEETLRKYPSVSFLFRRCLHDYQLPGTDIVLEKDMYIFISLLGLHYDPDYFPDPEKFDPERFSEENKDKIIPFTYLPFGDGPRKCLAYRYAVMLVKVGLITFIKNYRFTLNKNTKLPLGFDRFSLTLVPKDDILLDIKKINI